MGVAASGDSNGGLLPASYELETPELVQHVIDNNMEALLFAMLNKDFEIDGISTPLLPLLDSIQLSALCFPSIPIPSHHITSHHITSHANQSNSIQ